MRRVARAIAAAVLIWAACGLQVTIHDQAQAARLDREREAIEAQRAEAVAAIREAEDAELIRLGIYD